MKEILLIVNFLWIFVNANVKKDCHFNDAIFNSNVFPNHACWKCYENLTDRGRLSKVYCLVTHDALNFTVPGFMITNKCIPFDYRSSLISDVVQSSMANETFRQWKKCCENALGCCEKMIKNQNGENFFNTCDAHWNGYSCFDETNPGDEVEQQCPYHFVRYDEGSCEHSYTRQCQSNGTWASPDLTQCRQNDRLSSKNIWHITMLTLSLIFCVLQLFAFGFCYKFQSKHLHTVIALILFIVTRNLLRLVSLSIILADSSTLTVNSLSCRLLVVFSHFAENMIYVCLALVALKLLQILKNTTENWGIFIMMSIGLLFAITSTISWSLMMKIYSNKLCWMYTENNFHWINNGMRFIMLTVAIFLAFKSAFFSGEIFDGEVKFLSKIFIIPLSTFLLPFPLLIASSILNCCELKEYEKLTLTFFELLQAMSLSLIFFTKSIKKMSIPEISIPWFTTKHSSQESNASLAPSRLSINRDEPLYSWQDVVACAKNSVCYDNEIASISSISTAPEPYKNPNEVIYEIPKAVNGRRHTIRHIMMRAKHNNHLSQIEEIAPRKVSTPPLPKNIPSEILDDVQLFDFYYKNLDSIFITDGGESIATRSSEGKNDDEKRPSNNRISRILSFGQNEKKKKLENVGENSAKIN